VRIKYIFSLQLLLLPAFTVRYGLFGDPDSKKCVEFLIPDPDPQQRIEVFFIQKIVSKLSEI
jgi:hypothetical protein